MGGPNGSGGACLLGTMTIPQAKDRIKTIIAIELVMAGVHPSELD